MFLEIYMFCVGGILISIVLPILRKSLPGGGLTERRELWKFAKPFLIVGGFSLLTALLVVAFSGDSLSEWKAALLAGYAWDSTLQKMKGYSLE